MPISHPTKGILTEKCRFCGWQAEADSHEDAQQAEMFHEDDHQPDYCPMCKPAGRFGGVRLDPEHRKACRDAAHEAELQIDAEMFGDIPMAPGDGWLLDED